MTRQKKREKKQPRRPLELARIRPQVIGWLVEGKSTRDVAALLAVRKVTVTHSAVARFADRHAAEIRELQGKIAKEVEDVTIADAGERVRRLGELYDMAEGELLKAGVWRDEPKWVAVYAELAPGEDDENVGETRTDDDGRVMFKSGTVLVNVRRFDAGALLAVKGLSHEIAEQLGQIVRKSESVLSTPEDDDGNQTPLPLIIYRAAKPAK